MNNNQIVLHVNNAIFALGNARRKLDGSFLDRAEHISDDLQRLAEDLFEAAPVTYLVNNDPNRPVQLPQTTLADLDDVKETFRDLGNNPPPPPVTDIAYKMTDKLFFLEHYEYEDNKQTSIEPALIVGAQVLFVFNTNNRQLAVYHADSEEGFTVKGSTLKDWDPEKSTSKNIRHPDKSLDQVFDHYDPVSWYENIRSKPKTLTGRINKHCVLLKVM